VGEKGERQGQVQEGPADGGGRPATWLDPKVLVGGIFVLSLSLRLLYITQIAATPLLHGLALDSAEYQRLALKILEGDFTHEGFIYLNAFYPFFLAGIYALFGTGFLAVGLVQAVMDALGCLLIYYIAVRWFNKKTGLIGALIYAVYGIAVFYTGILLGTTASIFLSLLFVASLLFAEEKGRPLLFCVSGMVFGLLVLARSNLVLFLPVLPFWFFLAVKKEMGLKRTAFGFGLVLVGFLLLTLPVSARNYMVQQRFSPFSVQGGINFYIGNNAEATGRFMSPEGVSVTPVKQVKTSIESAEKALGTSLSPAEASRYWLFRGLRFLGDHPVDAFVLYAKKFGLFWRKEEIGLNIDYSLSKDLAPLLQWPLVSFGLVAPLAVLGMVLSAQRRKDTWLGILFVIASMISVVLFFVAARYRMCVVPFLIIFSAHALHWLADRIKERRLKAVSVFALLLVVLWIGINAGLPGLAKSDTALKIHYRNLGLAYIRQGRPDLGARELEKAISFDPEYAEAYSGLGFALQRQGKLDEAIGCFEKAIALKPQLDEAHNNLGAIYLQQGRLDAAIDHFRQVLHIKPDHLLALQNLGAALVRKGEPDAAIAYLSKALELRPDSAEAHFNLGLALAANGEFEAAEAHLAEAARINPALEEAFRNFEQQMGR
jgi:Tfp pilus assembly protein PilF/4-amino-4-deoxy-L-arabinose transferase-like glycosyltransferase